MRRRTDGFRRAGSSANSTGHRSRHRDGQVNRHNKSDFKVDGVLQARKLWTVHPMQGGSQLDERYAFEVSFG